MLSIDLRSDTVTKPSKGMLEAMMSAPLGDDVFGEDPTVLELEKKAAAIFGKEAGMFCPSGTMSNQIGINILSRPQQEIICDHTSHVYLYEGGGMAFNSGLSVWLVPGDRGRITASQVEESIRADNVHFPVTGLVALENTHNRGGGSIYQIEEIRKIRKVCTSKNIRMHLDGARIFNALEAADYSAVEIGSLFDTISICLSKGLGAPVGSVLVTSGDLIKDARRVRKVFGGGMRQAGVIAAAGIYALDHNLKGLKDDHRRAGQLAQVLNSASFVESMLPVETNIVVFRLHSKIPVSSFLDKLAAQNVKAVQFGPQMVRMVTHLDFTDDMLFHTVDVLKNLKF